MKLRDWVYRFETGEVFAFNPDRKHFYPIIDFDPVDESAQDLLPV